MGQYSEMLVQSGRMSVWMAEQLLKGVTPQIFARKPTIGGKVIDANHAAFNFGHLALYPAKWLQVLGLDPKAAAAPAAFEAIFSAGKECKDDPDGTIYPAMTEITDAFFTAHKAALEAVLTVDDKKLLLPNPREGRMREAMPTAGAMLCFVINSHTMMHLGQVSTWRRCFGLGPVM